MEVGESGGKDGLRRGFLTEKDVPECVRMTCETFRLRREDVEQWFENRIFRNPYQAQIQGVGVGVWEGDELVAFRSMFAQPWWLEGEKTVVAFGAHTSVRDDQRGKGLGTELVKMSISCAPVSGGTSSGVVTQKIYPKYGFRFVGVDNDFYRSRVSYVGSMQKRLGSWGGRAVGSVLDLSLRASERRLRRAERLDFAVVTRCDERFDRLWETARPGYRSCLERSSAYLNWRLFDCATCPLHLAGAFDRAGELRAFGVWHVFAFERGIRMAVLRDLFAAPGDDAARESLLGFLLSQWRSQAITWTSLEVAHPRVTRLFRGQGFEHVPSKGNRYPMYSHRELPPETWEDWFRSGLDGDYSDLGGSQFL